MIVYNIDHSYSLACDIFDDKLKLAKQVGADIVINTKTQNLRDISRIVLTFKFPALTFELLSSISRDKWKWHRAYY